MIRSFKVIALSAQVALGGAFSKGICNIACTWRLKIYLYALWMCVLYHGQGDTHHGWWWWHLLVDRCANISEKV